MAFDPLTGIADLIKTVGDVANTVLNKFFGDKISEESKEKLSMAMKNELMEHALKEESEFRKFILGYEGKAEDVPKFVIILRALTRPIITWAVTGVYAYGWVQPERFSADQMAVLKPALLVVLIFWFGDKALQRSGILEVFKPKQ